jgi:hypothetical protein
MTAAASYGISHTDIEEFTGISHTDLRKAGLEMTDKDWQDFVTEYVEIIAQIVHKYCNVPTFDPVQPEALIVELRDGRGCTDDWDYPAQYLPQDYQFYLRELYYTGTIGVTPYAAVKVEEDTAGKTEIPVWVTRTARSSVAAGDYEVTTSKELTLVSFYNNVPSRKDKSVRFTYYTGYDPTSKQYADIKFQILRVFKNLILSKKGIQAIVTVFATGTRDLTAMPTQYSEAQILSHMEESTLRKYKRLTMCGPMFD